MSHRIAQLSDTHFLAAGQDPEGGFAYDTNEAFDAVLADLNSRSFDLVTVTGDVADHGELAQYRVAADAFDRIGVPVNVCPGNHDQNSAYESIGSAAISTSRVIRIDSWCHLFVDSNAGVLVADDSGRLVDPPSYDDRLHGNGSLGSSEAAWINEQVDQTDADHVFIWLHHPPAPTLALSADEAYAAEWEALIPTLSSLRGIAGGHTHVPGDYTVAGVPVFMAPSLKNNFDLEARTLLPPGYCSYRFDDDGRFASEVHLVGEDRWPRHPYGRAVHSLMAGEISYEQFDEIVARKTAAD